MRKTCILTASIIFSSLLPAQAPAASATKAGGRAAPAQPAYEVHPDRTVVFKLHAPDASDGKVSGDFTQAALTMTKAADGTWSVTAGPLRPALYDYAFTVNGVRAVDPANPMIGA